MSDWYCKPCSKLVTRREARVRYADRFDAYAGARPIHCCPLCGSKLIRNLPTNQDKKGTDDA